MYSSILFYPASSALLGGREDEKREEAPAASAPEASSERKVEKLSDDAVHRKTKNILEEYFSIKDKTVSSGDS
jgi:hypothetical protein